MLDLRLTWLKLQPIWLKERTLPEQLADVASKLLHPPSSTHEVLILLDRPEHLPNKVEQSPSNEFQKALSPHVHRLVQEYLLKHPNNDVRIAVVTCIYELTRITAPTLPYDDGQMKDIFELVVFSMKSLSYLSSQDYKKVINILNIVSATRLLVLILDLECYDLIVSMFHSVFTILKPEHPSSLLQDMENIMSMLLNESEDISTDLIYPVLSCLEEGNGIITIGQHLGQKFLENFVTRLIPYVDQVRKNTILENQSTLADISREGSTTNGSTMGFVRRAKMMAMLEDHMLLKDISHNGSIINVSTMEIFNKIPISYMSPDRTFMISKTIVTVQE